MQVRSWYASIIIQITSVQRGVCCQSWQLLFIQRRKPSLPSEPYAKKKKKHRTTKRNR